MKQRTRRLRQIATPIAGALAVLLGVGAATASILSVDNLEVPLTRAAVAKGTTWSASLEPHDDGLRYNPKMGDGYGPWVQSAPMAVGLAWRPPRHMSLDLIVMGSKTDAADLYANAYVRFGADAVHWSSWHVLTTPEKGSPTTWGEELKKSLGRYTGAIGVPRAASSEWEARREAWKKTRPAWESDDDEYARWLVKKDRLFFAKSFPLIGWVQLRVEWSHMADGTKLTKLHARSIWSVGGVHVLPRDGKPSPKEGKPWFLDLRPRTRKR